MSCERCLGRHDAPVVELAQMLLKEPTLVAVGKPRRGEPGVALEIGCHVVEPRLVIAHGIDEETAQLALALLASGRASAPSGLRIDGLALALDEGCPLP